MEARVSVETEDVKWVLACNVEDIDEEDVIRFDHAGSSFAIYRIAQGFFASDGWCTHERAHLADGFVIGREIECPLHQGRFEIASGKPKSPPVCVQLKTYLVKVEGDKVLLALPVRDAS
jgi:3-phenylpropionate/trans-cinnamate dioxygenase ferredoxin subunit